MPRQLNTYMVNVHRAIPGVQRHRRQVETIVAAPSRKAAAAIHGRNVTAHYIATYGMEGNADDQAAARANPGVVLYRPHSGQRAPWVPWDQDYPLDQIPSGIRDPDYFPKEAR